MSITLTPDVRARLDAHLDAVEQTLAASGRSREQRRGIVDDLEAQIQEMLAARSPAPALADLEAVLTQLDPPSAYADAAARPSAPTPVPPPTPRPSAPTAAPVRPRYSRSAIWGLVCILLSLLPLPMMAIGALFVARAVIQPMPVQVGGGPEIQAPILGHANTPLAILKGVGLFGSCMFVIMGPLALAGTVLGWVAFGQIRHSAGRIRGTGLALFDGLFYPCLCLILSVITPFFLPLLGLVLLLASIAVIYIIIRVANGHRVLS